MLRLLPLVAAVAALAACGGGTKARPQTTRAHQHEQCHAPKALARLHTEIAAIRRAAALPTKDTLQGNPQVNRATDRFLNDVALAPIGDLRRNRLIDHAAGALAGACEQCFQALEASRPVIGIRLGTAGACS